MENKKLYCILAYIGPLWLVGLLSAPNEPDVKFHVNQGIVLSILDVVLYIVASILAAILGWHLLFLSTLIWLAVGVSILVLAIMGIMNANNGVQKELPVIGKIKILK